MSNEQMGKRRGLMLVLSSPSGAGKTTLSHMLLNEFEDVNLSVSATTRKPRPNEQEGAHYHFKSVEDFKAMIAGREFLEWAHVFDKYYGTPRADTVAKLESGEDILFDVDWQGADALHDQMPNDVVSVFILPPSISALHDRLAARPGSTPEMLHAAWWMHAARSCTGAVMIMPSSMTTLTKRTSVCDAFCWWSA